MKKTNVLGLALLSTIMLLSSCGSEKEADYQYNTYMSATPSTWNVHTWQNSDESVVFAYTEIGLYDFILDFDDSGKAVGYKIVSEMADGEPIDTATDGNDANDLTDEELDRYTMDAETDTEGVKWIINLNQDACWEDGTPINADTYIYSMQKLLDPKMQNYRASSFYLDTLQIANAENYYKSNRTTFEQYSKYCYEEGYENADYYYSFSERNEMVAAISTEYDTIIEYLDDQMIPTFEKNKAMFDAFNGLVTFEMIEKTDGDGNKYQGINKITLTDKQKGYKPLLGNANAASAMQYLAQIFGASGTDSINATIKNLTYLRYTWPELSWDKVGLVKSGEYQLTFYLAEEIELFYMKYNLSGNWIVYEPYYEGGMSQSGDLKITNYATKQDNYMSYGPYKLTQFQPGKSMILEKNEKWYGYSDGEHVGQFQTNCIKFSIISEHSVAMQKFLKGELDDISLTPEDMKKYGSSERLYKTQTTYSQKLTFNSDYNTLKARQNSSKNENKTILANKDFREAFSYAMDRSKFASEYTSGHVPSTVLLNNQYISDYNTNEVYRETPQGMSVSTDIYGDIKNGFSVEKAKELFTKAYNTEINSTTEGHLLESDTINIQILLYNTDSEASLAQMNFIRDMLKNATEGTPLEGKIEITTRKDEDYYNTAYDGDFDAIWSIWGGMTMDPFGFMQVYTSESVKCEYGFHPENEPLTISKEKLNADEDKTMTFDQWRQAISTGGIYAKGDHEVRLNILAELEKAIILRYETICFTSRAEAELLSYKINFGCEDDLPLVGRGGIRYITYNYTADEWQKIKGKLDYTVSADL